MAFTDCSARTWQDRGRTALVRHDHVTRWASTRATSAGEVDRDDRKMMDSSSYAFRASREKLKEMELWLDEAGVDRRGGGGGPPAAILRRFTGKGIGLEAAVDLERDSTVRNVIWLYTWIV